MIDASRFDFFRPKTLSPTASRGFGPFDDDFDPFEDDEETDILLPLE